MGAKGWLNQLELSTALGAQQAAHLSTACATRREQQIQKTSFDSLYQVYGGQVALGLLSFGTANWGRSSETHAECYCSPKVSDRGSAGLGLETFAQLRETNAEETKSTS
jgi:hypothetical protein